MYRKPLNSLYASLPKLCNRSEKPGKWLVIENSKVLNSLTRILIFIYKFKHREIFVYWHWVYVSCFKVILFSLLHLKKWIPPLQIKSLGRIWRNSREVIFRVGLPSGQATHSIVSDLRGRIAQQLKGVDFQLWISFLSWTARFMALGKLFNLYEPQSSSL